MDSAEAITDVRAREVLDSRGYPTVEVEIHCSGGAFGRAIVPAGASTGRHEVKELRDGDTARYAGKGVRQALANILQHIGPKLLGFAVDDQGLIDRTLCQLDGTPDKSHLGANAILGVSLACAHAAAAARRQPLWQSLQASIPWKPAEPRLPLPMVNLISGGLHAGGNVDFQDFLLLPVAARSYSEALQMAVAAYRAVSVTLKDHGCESVLVGDEGGFGPKLDRNEQAIELLLEAFARAGLQAGRDAAIAIDVASTQLYTEDHYCVEKTALTSDEMVEFLAGLVSKYPIWSVEDGMAEDDWDGWKKLTDRLGRQVQLVGDDLFVTNPERLQRGIAAGVANSVLVKLNQIGTLTETLEVIALARAAGYRPVISARSGETEDCTIADLAVATGAGQIKIGSIARGERLAKYNQLLRIEEQLGADPPFAGWAPISHSL
jgi:enolase